MDLPDPEAVFRIGNLTATAGWAALVLSPAGRHWTPRVWRLTGWWLPLALALAYAALLIVHGPRAADDGGFGSLAAVRALFGHDGLLAAGWLHYLAFDLFVGTWMARDAAARGLQHLLLLPALVLTFLFGPAGLLIYAAVTPLHRRDA